MGPKKQVVSRPKRSQAPVPPERRTKVRHDVPAPPSPVAEHSLPSPPPSPPSPSAERFAGRIVSAGRKVDFPFFAENGFQLGHWINQQGWKDFCCLDVPYFPHLVRQFYASLKIGHSGIECTVKGTKIVLTELRLAQILDIPREGISAERLSDRGLGLSCILETDDIAGIDEIRANQLSVEMRLLHHIVGRIFIPKTGRFDFISERELCFMYHMISGAQINLPAFMMRQMKEAATRVKVCLPFGMAITLIFHEFGVPLDGEPSKALLGSDTYCDRTLHRMGFRKQGGHWTKRISGQRQHHQRLCSEGESESSEAPAAVPLSPPPDTVPAPAPATAPEAPSSTVTLDEQSLQRIADMVSSSIRADLCSFQQQLQSVRADLEQLHSLREDQSSTMGRVDALIITVRGLSDRLTLLEGPADISDLTSEAGRLRGRIDRGISQVLDELHQVREAQRTGAMTTMMTLNRLDREVEELVERFDAAAMPPPRAAPQPPAPRPPAPRPPFRL